MDLHSLINFDNWDTPDIRDKAARNVAEGGPNSGFEIDEVRFFKDPELTGQFPEMKDDIDLIISTESYIGRLVDFNSRLQAANGMSRGMAYELNELIPDLQSFNPSNYTEDISGVGWQASCEQISAQIWVVIAAAAAFVVALIYKFLRWIFGRGNKGSGGSGSGNLKDVKKGIQESEKKAQKQERIVGDVSKILDRAGNKTIDVKIPQVVSKPEIQNARIPEPVKERILSQHDDLTSHINSDIKESKIQQFSLKELLVSLEGGRVVNDYLTNPNRYARVIYARKSEALDLVLASIHGFRTYARLIIGQVDLLKEMLDELEGEMEPRGAVQSVRFDSALQSLDVVVAQTKSIRIGNQTFDSMMHWGAGLSNSITQAAMDQPKFEDLEELLVGHERASRRLASAEFSSMLVFIEALEAAKPVLERIEKMANYQKTKMHNLEVDKRGQDRAATIMRVQKVLANNLSGLMRVYSEVSRVIVEVNLHGYKVVDTLRKHSAEIIAVYNRFKEPVPPTLEEIHEALVEKTGDYKENIINDNMMPASITLNPKISIGDDDDDDDDNVPSFTLSEAQLRGVLGKG